MLTERGAIGSYLIRWQPPRGLEIDLHPDQPSSRRSLPSKVSSILAITMLYSIFAATLVFGLSSALPTDAVLETRTTYSKGLNVQLGPRPFYLVDNMDAGSLKNKLASCSNGPFKTSDFSIGHRGAALQFPEHTAESYRAAAREGAGIIECDVTFTKDKKLVCRHSQYVQSHPFCVTSSS